jgi:hypothetical protein
MAKVAKISLKVFYIRVRKMMVSKLGDKFQHDAARISIVFAQPTSGKTFLARNVKPTRCNVIDTDDLVQYVGGFDCLKQLVDSRDVAGFVTRMLRLLRLIDELDKSKSMIYDRTLVLTNLTCLTEEYTSSFVVDDIDSRPGYACKSGRGFFSLLDFTAPKSILTYNLRSGQFMSDYMILREL